LNPSNFHYSLKDFRLNLRCCFLHIFENNYANGQ